jgi:hypothetical protein
MALQNVVKHYADECDMPSCICVDGAVVIFLLDDELTTDGKPYFPGTVTEIEILTTGGVDITIQYDDATLPLVEGEPMAVIFPPAEDATVCDPDCAEDCDWFTKVRRMMDAEGNGGLLSRWYIAYTSEEDVANGVFQIPRIPFDPGFRLTDVRITCFTYDINTTGTFTLKVGATNIAQFVGNLAQQRQMTILVTDLLNDELPELHITGVTNGVYGLAAAGLVLELLGIIIPTP